MTALTLAKPADLERLMQLVADYHAEAGISQPEAARRDALLPLLEGSPHGAVYLIGPARAPIGYIAISFGWSIALGGLEGRVDEICIRRSVRGRGIGADVLGALPRALSAAGLRALQLTVPGADEATLRHYRKLGFQQVTDRATLTLHL